MVMCTLDVPEESPSLSHVEPNREAERIAAFDSIEDPFDFEICRAIKTQVIGPHAASSISPAVQFSSRLSELNTQLAALENIADCLERDFSNSRMVNKNILLLFILIVLLMTSKFTNGPVICHSLFVLLCLCSW